MISSFFKTRKTKQFNHIPRYYNEEREDFKNRYAEIEAEVLGERNSEIRFRPKLKEHWRRNQKTTPMYSKSNVRLILIAALLFCTCYYILFL